MAALASPDRWSEINSRYGFRVDAQPAFAGLSPDQVERLLNPGPRTVGDPKIREELKARFPDLARALSPAEWNTFWSLVQRLDYYDQSLLEMTDASLAREARAMHQRRASAADDLMEQFKKTNAEAQLLAGVMHVNKAASQASPKPPVALRSSGSVELSPTAHDMLVAKLNRHIAKAKSGGEGHRSKKAFCNSLGIDPSEYYRWQRGEPTKAPSYKGRIEDAIAALPD
jgi:hypothetical protein